MSQSIPKIVVSLGETVPPAEDVIECKVHLGATKEVSSFELLLQNWYGKYNKGSATEILVGQTGGIGLGRGDNAPPLISLKIESVKYETDASEHYVRVEGRCWGCKLFDRIVTKAYLNRKGEYIVKDLLDNFVGLGHTRGDPPVELVEDTDTTYAKLEYENTPVWDILKYIAESSDKEGVIGYDFRVAPDGLFEFFPKNSKTSLVDLSETLEVGEHREDIHRIRNKITVYGAMGRKEPVDGDEWTEDTLDGWDEIEGDLSLESSGPSGSKVGSKNVLCDNTGNTELQFRFNHNIIVKNGMSLKFWYILTGQGFNQFWVRIYAPDLDNRFEINLGVLQQFLTWISEELPLGPSQTYDADTNPNGIWTPVGYPDWFSVTAIEFFGYGSPLPKVGIDGLHFYPLPFQGVVEDTVSQHLYTDDVPREYSETDEELLSDNECLLRAQALLAYLKDPAQYLSVNSTVLDYGTTPLLPAYKNHIELPNEGIDSDFRIESADYHFIAETQTLEVAMELGKEPPQLADYLYGLRAFTVNVEQLARTKVGRSGGGGGGGGGGTGGISAPNKIIMDENGYIFIQKHGDVYPLMCLKWDLLCFGSGGGTEPDVYLRRIDVDTAYLKALAGAYVDGNLLPFQDDTYDVGVDGKKWRNGKFSGGVYAVLGDFTSLDIGGVEVLSTDRYLHNVTADAGIITSGVFGEARLTHWYESSVHFAAADITTLTAGGISCWSMSIGGGGCNLKTPPFPGFETCPYYGSFSGFESCPQYGCANYSAGDLCFKKGKKIPFINGMTITEAEKLGLGHGLAFLNKKGKLVMVLDADGNLSIAGKVKKLGA